MAYLAKSLFRNFLVSQQVAAVCSRSIRAPVRTNKYIIIERGAVVRLRWIQALKFRLWISGCTPVRSLYDGTKEHNLEQSKTKNLCLRMFDKLMCVLMIAYHSSKFYKFYKFYKNGILQWNSTKIRLLATIDFRLWLPVWQCQVF